MATGEVTHIDPATVKYWSGELLERVKDKDPLKAYTGKSYNSIIRIEDSLVKGAGDEVRIFIGNSLSGEGWMGTQSAKERAEALSKRYEDIRLNAFGHTVKYDGLISQQRVKYSIRQQALDELADWCTYTVPQGWFLHLAGITSKYVHYISGATLPVALPTDPTVGTPAVFGTVPVAPVSGRIYRAAARATDEALQSTDLFSFALLDQVLPIIKESLPRIPPPYTLFLSPRQAGEIKGTANSRWENMQLNAIAAGKESGLTTAKIGRYMDVDVVETPFIPRGIHSTTGAVLANTRRAVLCGGQALSVANGRISGGSNMWQWVEEEDTIERVTWIGVQAVTGCKKTQYKLDSDATNYTDYGVVVLSTYVT